MKLLYMDDVLNYGDKVTIAKFDEFCQKLGETHLLNATPFGYLPNSQLEVVLKDGTTYRMMAGHKDVPTMINYSHVEPLDADAEGVTWIKGNELQGFRWDDVVKFTLLRRKKL